MHQHSSFLRNVKSPLIFAAWLLAISGISTLNAQSLDFCGIHKNTTPLPRDYKDVVVYDRFGNSYSTEQLYREQSAAKSGCNSGIFMLNFIGSFPADEEETICTVFGDLSGIISGGASVSIPVNIIREPNTYGAPAAGSDLFVVDCGLLHSSILQTLLTGQNNLPAGVGAGVVHIRTNPTSTATWHSLQDDLNGPTGPNEVDLYSVVLHEALHLLGFASRIGLGGDAIGGGDLFSDWDRFLYSMNINRPLIMPNPLGPCCNSHKFNHTAFPNMPQDLSGGCSMNIAFFDGTTAIAPVNNINLTPSSDFEMANKLSHLDKNCSASGENFVMHPGIAQGEERRHITDPELAILCNLGYNAVGGCTSCLVLATDDNIQSPIILTGPGANNPLFIPFSTLLANDAYPAGTIPVYLSGCGFDAGIQVTPVAGGFNVTGLTPGIWSFCYTISGCAGACEEATVTIVVQNTGIDTDCEPLDCNLLCFGTFEGFEPAWSSYYTQLGLPNFHIATAPSVDNSVDINVLGGTNNKVLHWGRSHSGSWEVVRLPLSMPVEPGCTISVSFLASASISGQGSPSHEVNFIGITAPPCTAIAEPFCQTQFQLCSSPTVDAFCLQSFTMPNDAGITYDNTNNVVLGVDLLPYSFTWTNTTGQPITDLLVYGNPGAIGTNNYHFYLDDISVYNSCTPAISIKPEVLEQCSGGQIVIEYTVCLSDDYQGSPLPITMQADIPAFPGLSIVPGGGFDAGGQAQITLPDMDGDPFCTTLTLTLHAGANLPPGTGIPIGLDALSDDICVDLNGGGNEITVVLEDCVDPCDEQITVNHQCREVSEGHWVDRITLYFNGNPIAMYNDPNCCVTWEYINGIPTYNCPRLNWQADQNFNPLTLPEGQHYKVTIICGDCVYVEDDIVDCSAFGPIIGGGGKPDGRDQIESGSESTFAVIYPNPAKNQIAVRLKEETHDNQQFTLQIYDALGRQVMNHSLLGSTQWQVLDISSFSAGIYAWYLVGEGKEKVLEQGKIVVIP
jgi:hypothetical protein